MYKLLTGFSNVQFLTLPCALVKAMRYAAELVPRMPMFNNLVDLEFLSPWSIDLDCVALWTLLQKSPCLKALKFSGVISREEVDGILNPVPPCFLSHLKCIKVAEYRGDENELSAVKILLKNAIVLDKMVITCPKLYARHKESQEKICKQLKELRGRSQNCKIVLERASSEILL